MNEFMTAALIGGLFVLAIHVSVEKVHNVTSPFCGQGH
jgi:hypothetical protein